MSEQFVCAAIVDYEDGASGVMALHRGDLESCKRVMDATPAVTYTGDRRAISAAIEIIPAATFDELMKLPIAQQHN